MKPIHRLFALLLLFSGFASLRGAPSATNCGCSCCTGKTVCCCQPKTETPAEEPAEIVHPLRGSVVSASADGATVVVRHEEIPGYMRPMTMRFRVGAADRVPLKVGQRMTATLVQRREGFWLRDIRPEAGEDPAR